MRRQTAHVKISVMKNVCVLHDHVGSALRKGWGNGQNSFKKEDQNCFLAKHVKEMPSLFQLEEAICNEKRMEKTGQSQGSGKNSLLYNKNSQIEEAREMSHKVSSGFWASPENLGTPLY